MMHLYLLIPAAIAFFGLNGIFTRLFQVKYQRKKSEIFLFQTILSLIAALFYLSQCGGTKEVSFFTIASAIGMGIAFFTTLYSCAVCFAGGSMAVASVVINLSLVLPLIYSWAILSEPIYRNSIIGLALFCVTFLLSASSGSEKQTQQAENIEYQNQQIENNPSCEAIEGKKTVSPLSCSKWLLFLLLGFLSNGGSAVIQKQHRIVYGETNASFFMATSYLTAAVLFGIVTVLQQHKTKSVIPSKTYVLPFVLLSILCGFSMFAGNGLLMVLSTKVNGGILYPFLNGGLTVFLGLSSLLFFKEKLTAKKGLSFLTGLCAILLLSL